MTTIKLFFSLFKINFFKDSLFSSVVVEWNKVDLNIRNSQSLIFFKNLVLKFIRLGPTLSLISMTLRFKTSYKIALRLEPSKSQVYTDSQDCINPICSCGHDIETTTYLLLHCHHYTCARQTLCNKITNFDLNILE